MEFPRHALLIFSYFFKTQKRPFKVAKHFQPFSKLCTTPVKKRRQGGLLLNYNTSSPAAAQCSDPGRELPCLQQCRVVQGQVTPGLNCWKEKPTMVQVTRMGGEQCTPFIKLQRSLLLLAQKEYMLWFTSMKVDIYQAPTIWNQLPVFVCLDSISKFLKIFSFYSYKIMSGCTFHGVYLPCVYSMWELT